MAQTINDSEFGTITIKRSALAQSLRLKINHQGALVVSMPKRAPLYLAKQLINQARDQVRRGLKQTKNELTILRHGDLIGKSHRLVIRQGEALHGRILGTFIEISVPPLAAHDSHEVQSYIKEFALKALRTQARAYLSRQLANLANTHGFAFESVRFSNAGTRWGSCSTSGTISLNIWLMQLPFELIDYVIIHELCHTRHMDHSAAFWQQVEQILPDYRLRRRALKDQRPYL
ncbi:MAG TPA: SprT family zinc-dependent metalloprotease [Candidatus Saccharimonadales bacterium]|nr:SprT family zinc-dependent metalloprotease [Candidatus Saccharimonadales bacterium]